MSKKQIDINNPVHWILIVSGLVFAMICFTNGITFAIFFFLVIAVSMLNGSFSPDKKARMKALEKAGNFLEPYDENNILGNLKLTNKFCTIYLHRNEHMIGIKEKVAPFRESMTPRSDRKVVFEAWNAICSTFHHNKKYEDLIQECILYGLTTAPKEHAIPINTRPNAIKPKVDINNSSIIEITDLPGINIALSKRIIKKREEIGGFKDTQEFYDFINLKPHFIEKLKEQVYVTKMKGTLKIKHTSERSVDF